MLTWIVVAAAILVAWQIVVFVVTPYQIAPGLRKLRDRADIRTQERSAGALDRLQPSEQYDVDRALEKLKGAGGEVLGRMVELNADGSAIGIAHWFAADDGRTCGWLTVAGSARERVVCGYLFSGSDDGHYAATRWGAQKLGHLAGPPEIHRQQIPSRVSITTVLDRHQALVAAMGRAPLVRVRDLAGARGLREAVSDTARRWRGAQPPRELLEADVRSFLPGSFGKFVPRVIRLLSRPGRVMPDQRMEEAPREQSAKSFVAILGVIGVIMLLGIVSTARLDVLPLVTYAVGRGTVDSVGMELRQRGRGSGWVPRVYYRYSVAGRAYAGRRVTPSDRWGSREWAAARTTRYTPRATVTVRYDPKTPERAFLEASLGQFWLFTGAGLAWLALTVPAVVRAVRVDRHARRQQ